MFKMMNKYETLTWENYYLSKIRFSNRCGNHYNCIRVFKNNKYIHERVKFDIAFKLIREGFTVMTEAIFEESGRADVLAIKGKHAYIIEIETSKSKSLMKKKILEKQKYPKDFELIIINAENFDINKWDL